MGKIQLGLILVILLWCQMYEYQAFPANKDSPKEKSSLAAGLKKLGEKMRLTGDNSIFKKKPSTDGKDKPSKGGSDQRNDNLKPKPIPTASSNDANSEKVESYKPPIASQVAPAPSSITTGVPSGNTYRPPIPSSGGGYPTSGSKTQSYQPPVPNGQSGYTSSGNTSSTVVLADVAALDMAHEATNPGSPFPYLEVPDVDVSAGGGGITASVDLPGISLGLDGGVGGGGGGGDVTDCGCGEALVTVASAVGGCLWEGVKAICDPSNWSCCCCQ